MLLPSQSNKNLEKAADILSLQEEGDKIQAIKVK